MGRLYHADRQINELHRPGRMPQIQACDAFIGHDSGISHLAGALGLRGIVLWGNTVEEIWRPPQDRIILLKHPAGLKMISLSQVMEKLKLLLSDP